MSLQTEFINALQKRCEADGHVLAFWLEGSLGKNAGDAYSDVDAHLLVRDADLVDFRRDGRAFLQSAAPLVLFRALFGGEMMNALTANGLRLDIWTHSDTAPVTKNPAAALPVWERTPGLVVWDTTPLPASLPPNTADLALKHINEFWRCIAILPSVIGRGEKIVAVFGFFVELGPLTELLILSTGAPRDTGVKHLNRFLPKGAQEEIEAALTMLDLSLQSLTAAHFGLVRIMQKRGPEAAARLGAIYPADLEAAAVRYAEREIAAILAR